MIFTLSVLFLALFAFGVVSITKLLYFSIPFFCVFLSTLFFFGYIVWFDNGFKGDEEYTLEELQELERGYLQRGYYKNHTKETPNNTLRQGSPESKKQVAFENDFPLGVASNPFDDGVNTQNLHS